MQQPASATGTTALSKSWEGRNAALGSEVEFGTPPVVLAPVAELLTRFPIPHAHRSVVPGTRVARGGELLDRVFFPLDTVVLMARQTPLDKMPLTVGLIGRESLVGWNALLQAPTWSHDAIVMTTGTLAEVRRADLEQACAAYPQLRDFLLRIAHNQTLQLAQSVVANLGHSIERRLARWLTMFDDRIDGDFIPITHDQLAQLLNARRASITDALHVLEGEQLVRGLRGRVQIRDRYGLQARCWQSYGLSENDHRSLLTLIGLPGPTDDQRQPSPFS